MCATQPVGSLDEGLEVRVDRSETGSSTRGPEELEETAAPCGGPGVGGGGRPPAAVRGLCWQEVATPGR